MKALLILTAPFWLGALVFGLLKLLGEEIGLAVLGLAALAYAYGAWNKNTLRRHV